MVVQEELFKELKALEGEPNPKTEADSGLLAGFSSSSNDFFLPFHSNLMVFGGAAELPPKPQHLSRAGLCLSQKTDLSRN